MPVRCRAWAAIAAALASFHVLTGAGTALAQSDGGHFSLSGTQSSSAAATLRSASGAASEATSGAAAEAMRGDNRSQTLTELAADIHETIARVTVSITLPNGRPWRGDMLVTHFRPDGAGPFPVVVLSHGRLTARHEPRRWRSLSLARFWLRRGFAVVVPTRVGYGELGQSVDPEAAGACEWADFRPAVEAMSRQIESAVGFASGLPWVDGKRVILGGVSYGGIAAIHATARQLPGVIGAINFAGGLGGNPVAQPGEPCQAARVSEILAAAGAKSRVPTLWLYSRNDRFWGEAWPQRWHQAFKGAGGNTRFVSFPPVGEDGHKLLTEGFALWRPVVDRYLASLGVKVPRAALRLPGSSFAAIGDVEKLPHVGDNVKAHGYAVFLEADLPRAFAVSASGSWAWRSGPDAVDAALHRCQMHSDAPCALYAVDDRVVWAPAVK